MLGQGRFSPTAMFLALGLVCIAACKQRGQQVAAESAAVPLTGANGATSITPDLIDRYIGFDKDFRQVRTEWARQSGGHVGDLGADVNFGQKLNVLRAKWKLSETEEDAVAGLFQAIQADRAAWQAVGGEAGLARLEKQEKDLANMGTPAAASAPPQMREYLKSLQAFQQGTAAKGAKTIADLKRARDLGDVREKYGNANVDYVLKNGQASLAPDTEFAAAVTGKH